MLPGRPDRPGTDPVFVLCAGRSGATLLRCLLDAHPELACAPETGLAAMCVQMAGVWSQLEDSTQPTQQVSGPPAIPDAALAGIRHTMNRIIAPYLQRRRKRRYCDRGLGAAEHADVLRAVFPGAKFLCLYRHPLDVIASGLEAGTWRRGGLGLGQYADRPPRNAVLALAQAWAANVALILAVEERFHECSHRVRYEDLLADPEQVSDRIFRFLVVPPVPRLPEMCLAAERERAGPSEYKPGHASRIGSDSVDWEWSIPAAMTGSPLTATINALTDRLGYARIGDRRGITGMAPDPRPGGGPVARRQPANGSGQTPPGLRLVAAHLLSGLAGLDDGFTQRWEPCSLETFLVTVTSAAAGDVAARWRIDMRTRTVTSAEGLPAGETAGALWEIVGPVDLWARVVEGETNLGAALRRRVLRYRDAGDPTPAMLNRIAMLADLLGVTTWQRAQSLRPGERWPRKGWPGDAGSPRPRPGRAVPAAKAPGPVRTNGAAHTDSGAGPPRANGPLRTDGATYTSAPADANSASHANGAAHTSAPTEADPPGSRMARLTRAARSAGPHGPLAIPITWAAWSSGPA
jgi:hypothetical protein